MLLAATYGASPSIAVIQTQNLQQGLYDCMDELQRRKEWLIRKQPEPWAAMVMSDNTRNFYGRTAGRLKNVTWPMSSEPSELSSKNICPRQ